MDIKKSVRVALAFRSKTQSQLAREIGMNVDALSQALIRNSMNSKQISKIALALDFKASELIALGETK